jgi:hypothetical protein
MPIRQGAPEADSSRVCAHDVDWFERIMRFRVFTSSLLVAFLSFLLRIFRSSQDQDGPLAQGG